MRSVKPGRGPSMMGGIVGIFMILAGIAWTITAAQANIFFALFGVAWTGIAIVQTVYNFKNAKNKNRYSAYDIVDSREEPDPLNMRYGAGTVEPNIPGNSSRFCPYCGKSAASDYEFCPGCGRELP